MSLLTLLLVGAICSAEGPDKICTYVDVTDRMEVQTDDQCFVIAQAANRQSAQKPGTPRYACVTHGQYLTLLNGSEPIKLAAIPEVL